MSAFIVISVKDSLNWIVDGIINSRPHNPIAKTCISIGKIKKEDNDKYLYEYTTFSKHVGGANNDKTIKNTGESDIPRNLFKNQIAQFLNVCENDGGQINIFLLDNPTTDEDFAQSTWITEEIRAVYESHCVTNFQLTRVLFSYQIDRPADVTRQVSGMILRDIQALDLKENDDFVTRILFIDNQNRNGAAICLDKEGHDIMLPRMLCDLMMLLSNKNDSYNTTTAITGNTGMFAVGYSECMYYQDDIFRYYSLAGQNDLLSHILYNKNDCTSLDYEREPFGLNDRVHRLAPKYEPVPFNSDINDATTSVDKTIDDILISLKDDITKCKEEALNKAAEKDRLATEKARKERLEIAKDGGEGSETPEMEVKHEVDSEELSKRKGCNFFARIFHPKKKDIAPRVVQEDDTDPRVANITITAETDKVKKEYPDFISRKAIYEQYLLEKEGDESVDSQLFNDSVKSYYALIGFIQSRQFKQYLKDANAKEDHIWKALIKRIDSINLLNEERIRYSQLKTKVNDIKQDLELSQKAIKEFRLTTHCSSVDNLIDIDKLKEVHDEGKETRIKGIVKRWNERSEETRSLNSIKDDLAEIVKWEVFGFYYIKWEKPFEFIKDIDISNVCKHLKKKSQPFVNTYTLSPNADNLTSFCLYTDNPDWKEAITNGKANLNPSQISVTLSNHICSKICMFQFLQMSHELIDGLVDCYDN